MENIKTSEKPLSLIKEETKIKIIEYINTSKLPLLVLEPLMKDLYLECREAYLNQAKAEKIEYEQKMNQVEK